MAIELVSFDELKLYLGLSKTELDYPELTLIQESVVSAVESYTRRILTEDKYSKTVFVFCKTKMIMLDAIPIKTISSILIDGIATTDYKIKQYGVQLDKYVEDVELSISYTGGLETVNSIIKRAALLQTVYEFQNKDSIGIQTISTDGGTTVKPELGLLKEVKILLDGHIHPFPVF